MESSEQSPVPSSVLPQLVKVSDSTSRAATDGEPDFRANIAGTAADDCNKAAVLIKVFKLSKTAVMPTKSTPLSAGYDLYSAKKYLVPAHGKQLIDTDLRIEMAAGTYGRIAPTSKLSWKNHTSVSAGVVDADYRGNVRVVMFNHGNKPLVLESGEKVAQLICEKLAWPIDIVECRNLSETVRADRGVKRSHDDSCSTGTDSQ